MLFLVPLSEVRDKLGYDGGIDTIDDAISKSLIATTSSLSGYLRTRFELSENTDVYNCVRTPVNGRNLHLQLLLSKGFVDMVRDVVITYGGTYKDRERYTLDPECYVINYEMGVIDIFDINLDFCYLQVTYTSGFNIDLSDDTLFAQNVVPWWLKNVALELTTLNLKNNPIISLGEDGDFLDNSTSSNYKSEEEQFLHSIADKIRYQPIALHSISQSIVYTTDDFAIYLITDGGDYITTDDGKRIIIE